MVRLINFVIFKLLTYAVTKINVMCVSMRLYVIYIRLFVKFVSNLLCKFKTQYFTEKVTLLKQLCTALFNDLSLSLE